MLKLLLQVSLSIILVATPAFADSKGAPADQVQLAVWHNGSRQRLKVVHEVMQAVQADHEGLVVTVRKLPANNAFRQLLRWADATERAGLPDLVIVPDVWLPTFAYALQPIEDVVGDDLSESYCEPVQSQLEYAGHVYGVPWTVRSRALFYRPSVLDDAGMLPPRNWKELMVCARRCHRPPDMYGFGMPGVGDAAPKLLLQILWAQGAAIPPIDEPDRLSNTQLKSALEMYHRLHEVAQPEVLTWEQMSLREFFAADRIAMLVADNTFERFLHANAPKIDYATCAVPAGKRRVPYISVNNLCLLKSSQRKTAARKVFTSITGEKASRIRLQLGGIPVLDKLVAEYRLSDEYSAYLQNLQNSRGLPMTRWDVTCTIFTDALFGLLTGRTGIDETCRIIRKRFAEGESATGSTR